MWCATLFSNELVVHIHKPTRPSREIRVCRTKGGLRGVGLRLRDWCLLIMLPGSRLFLLDVLIPACMPAYCLTQAHLVLLAWAKLSSKRGQGDVGSMPAQPGIYLLSDDRQ